MDGVAVVDGTLLGFVDVVGIVEGVSDGCWLGATVSVGLDVGVCVGMCVGTVDIVGDDVCACTI